MRTHSHATTTLRLLAVSGLAAVALASPVDAQEAPAPTSMGTIASTCNNGVIERVADATAANRYKDFTVSTDGSTVAFANGRVGVAGPDGDWWQADADSDRVGFFSTLSPEGGWLLTDSDKATRPEDGLELTNLATGETQLIPFGKDSRSFRALFLSQDAEVVAYSIDNFLDQTPGRHRGSWIYERETGEFTQLPGDLTEAIPTIISMTDDGERVFFYYNGPALVSGGEFVYAWDWRTDTLTPIAVSSDTGFSGDGTYLATATVTNGLFVQSEWEGDEFSLLDLTQYTSNTGFSNYGLSYDGRFVVVEPENSFTTYLWDTETGEYGPIPRIAPFVFGGQIEPIISSDGSTIVFHSWGFSGRTILKWTRNTKTPVSQATTFDELVAGPGFCADTHPEAVPGILQPTGRSRRRALLDGCFR